ncbi:MAG: cytochrome c biogenesis protein ResB [Calditerrivibrio sp.]|nr:cytochrome c biogenesis protein ResB [Calditerrivibrio sp.]
MLKKILNFFSSIKLALVLFLILGLTSGFGSFVSASKPDSGVLGFFVNITGKSHQEVISLFSKIGILDIYHSYFFISVLILFSVNLAVCTINRLPSIISILKKDLEVNRSIFYKVSNENVNLNIPINKVEEILDKKLRGFSKVEEKDGNFIYITAERGRLSRLGVHIVHLGVFLIIIAGIFGGIFGYSGNMGVMEGDTDNVVILKDNKTVTLPFKIKLENFYLTYYDNTTKPKEYSSDLVIIDDGPDKQFKVSSNRPIKYKNIRIYQASYGFYPSKDVKFIFDLRINDLIKRISVSMDEEYRVDQSLSFSVRDFAPSLSIDPQGRLINLNDMMINPAVIVEFSIDGDVKGSVPILANYPDTGKFDKFELRFIKAYGVQFSVFSVNYNPFLWLVYIGFIFLSIGMIIAFLQEHQILYIKLTDSGDSTFIEIKGYRHRFKKEVGKMLSDVMAIFDNVN